jgi:hypothetical protein
MTDFDYVKLVFAKIFNLDASHVDYKDKSFYPWTVHCTGTGIKRDRDDSRIYDPDYECIGSYSHTWTKTPPKSIIVNNFQDIKIHFFQEQDLLFNKINQVDDALSNKHLHTGIDPVLLVDDITLVNKIGTINPDHRGSNHLALDLSYIFSHKVFIPKGIYNFYDLARIAWQIKGNLFDNYYELASVSANSPISHNINGIVLQVNIDHGS